MRHSLSGDVLRQSLSGAQNEDLSKLTARLVFCGITFEKLIKDKRKKV